MRRPQNSAQPRTYSNGSPPARRATIASNSSGPVAAASNSSASSSAKTQPAARRVSMMAADMVSRRYHRPGEAAPPDRDNAMTYLDTPEESPLYPVAAAALGYVPNYTRVFALQPDAYPAWQELVRTATAGMDKRRYELVTLAAARQLGSRYCSLAHAKVLRDQYYDDAAMLAIAADHHQADLSDVDVAIMDFAQRVAADPTQVGAADIDELRRHGLSEVDILQVVLTVNLRRFFEWDAVRGRRRTGRDLRPAQPAAALGPERATEPGTRGRIGPNPGAGERPAASGRRPSGSIDAII